MKRRNTLILLALLPLLPSLLFAQKKVLLGIDVLEAQGFESLKGKQVGLITNQTGVDSEGRSTADVLARAPGVKLIALFSPEHGIRGRIAHGQEVETIIDQKTHLPVYSLYGATQRPTPEMLNAIDVLVFDMQDVGVRFYTYITTMGMAMEEASRRGIPFMVLDRPDPLGGTVVEGMVLDPRIRHFTAYYSIPVRYGFTAGELAQWYNDTARLNAQVKVVQMINWKRPYFWEDTRLDFVGPSPNIQTPAQALLYAGIGMFEAANVSVGRGTDRPFFQFGAPWIDGQRLARLLQKARLPGVRFEPAEFVPESDLYAAQRCEGVRMKVLDREQIRPVDIFVTAACILRDLYPKEFVLRWDEIARVTGNYDFEHLFRINRPAIDMINIFHKSAQDFVKQREKYLMY
jgi:uncharacterized protein YbbC (DUF1343 family)